MKKPLIPGMVTTQEFLSLKAPITTPVRRPKALARRKTALPLQGALT